MAQLYEKLHAQDDNVNIAWLAQFSPEEKPDTLCIPIPSPHLSSLSLGLCMGIPMGPSS